MTSYRRPGSASLTARSWAKISFKVMRRGTKTRSDSDSPDLTNMNHANDASEPLTSSMLDEGATSPLSASHSKSGKHEGDSKKERVVKVALPGAKKAQSAAKKKKSTPDLVSWLLYMFTVRMSANFCILLGEPRNLTFWKTSVYIGHYAYLRVILFLSTGYPQSNHKMPGGRLNSFGSQQSSGKNYAKSVNRNWISFAHPWIARWFRSVCLSE